MTSSAAHPELIAHPLRGAALQESIDCTVWARFRTFDPTQDPDLDPYRPLANARVNLVCTDGTLVIAGETDPAGELFVSGSTTQRLIVTDVRARAAHEFYFEVLGPKNSAGDLKTMTYAVGKGQVSFPIASWSTRGWQEHEGHWGNFKLSSASFPLNTADPNMRSFTVGCHMCPYLKYLRTNLATGLYPENLRLARVRNGQLTLLPLPAEDRLSLVFFDVAVKDQIELRAYFAANAVTDEKIEKVTGSFKIAGTTYVYAKGEAFGFPGIKSANKIRLFGNQLELKNFLPKFIQINSTGTLIKKLSYIAANSNFATVFSQLTPIEKVTVALNWFIEFIAFRNLYVRAMNILLENTTKTNIDWQGLYELEVEFNDGAGVAYTTNYLTVNKKKITMPLSRMLEPREDTSLHELSHTFVHQYLKGGDASIYYPALTGDHHLRSHSNEFFAFTEGFPQFLASLFLNPSLTYLLNAPWPDYFKFQKTGTLNVRFGGSATEVNELKLEQGVGLVCETAFAAALTKLWIDQIWTGAGTATWITDGLGSGGLYPDANTPNEWLADPVVAERFSKLMDAVASASTVEGRRSTRRIVDRIEKSTAADASWSWTAIKPSMAYFRVENEFFVSSIAGTTGDACVVSRSSATDLEYRTSWPGRPKPSTKQDFALLKKTGDTLALKGIRIPAGASPPGLSATLVKGAQQIAAQVVRIDEYQASATFTGSALSAALGLYDLVLTADAKTLNILQAVKVVP